MKKLNINHEKNNNICNGHKSTNEKLEEDCGKTTIISSAKDLLQNIEDKIQDVKKTAFEKANIAEDYISDSYITGKIRAKILRDSLLHLFRIKVITTDGEVELIGEVDTEKNLIRCLEIANSVKHIKRIKTNKLHIIK